VNVPQQDAGLHIESTRETESEEGGGESRYEEEKKVEKVVGGGEEEREGEAKKEKKKVVVRQKKKTKTVPFRGTDDEVDAKADDFINKFKQQLKLQRLESLLRYRSPPTATATAP